MSVAAKEYGRALFELAEEENIQSEVLGQARTLVSLFDENPGFIRLLASPSLTKAEREGIIDRTVGGELHSYFSAFLKLLVKRDRAKEIPDCIKEYIRLWYEESGIAVAEVRVAKPLSETQKMKLHSALEKKTGRDIEMRVTVDPSIIGGVSVKIGGELYEDTLRGRLDSVKKTLGDKIL